MWNARAGIGVLSHAQRAEKFETADHPTHVRAECQCIAKQDPHDADYAQDDGGMHQRPEYVFAPDKPAIKERQPGQDHTQHECRRHQDPRRITRINGSRGPFLGPYGCRPAPYAQNHK